MIFTDNCMKKKEWKEKRWKWMKGEGEDEWEEKMKMDDEWKEKMKMKIGLETKEIIEEHGII